MQQQHVNFAEPAPPLYQSYKAAQTYHHVNFTSQSPTSREAPRTYSSMHRSVPQGYTAPRTQEVISPQTSILKRSNKYQQQH